MKILKYFTAVAALVTVFLVLDSKAQQGAIMAVDEPPAGAAAGVGSSVNSGGSQTRSGSAKSSARSSARSKGRNTKSAANSEAAKNTARQAKANKKYDGFVIGDKYTFLNFEVVSAEKPYHTRAAKENGAKGLVQVEILIDEDGSVLTARARTGNKELWPEAERAALASKFNRPAVYGKPARATGFLVYRFGPADD